MLRSLVGSEMCIRDSGDPGHLDHDSGRSQHVLGQPRGSSLWRFHVFPHPCLLYTSDAADDLLCVDLGGRRIIQKKNKV